MAPRTLTPQELADLGNASSSQIQLSLARFSGGGTGTWLKANAPHPDGCLPQNFGALGALPPADIIESIATLGPLHVIDGWGYLARAIGAATAGSPHVARHLAYYAELRAALSILASSGIGVFNTNTVIVDNVGGLAFVRNFPTHKIAWQALEAWSKQPESFQTLTRAIDIGGVTLYDVLTGYFSAPAGAQLAADLMRRWGFDLAVSSHDGTYRNISSYSPNELTDIYTVAPRDIDMIDQVWRCFEPQTFLLEKHMLRMLLEEQLAIIGSHTLVGRGKEYQRLDPRLKSLVSKEFIERSEEPDDHALLSAAASRSDPAQASEMIARAALLLRVALALANQNLRTVSVSPTTDLEFWWQRFGAERGFWEPGDEPEFMHSLWGDVDLALDDARQSAQAGRAEWLSGSPTSGLPRICEAERICLWMLCP